MMKLFNGRILVFLVICLAVMPMLVTACSSADSMVAEESQGVSCPEIINVTSIPEVVSKEEQSTNDISISVPEEKNKINEETSQEVEIITSLPEETSLVVDETTHANVAAVVVEETQPISVAVEEPAVTQETPHIVESTTVETTVVHIHDYTSSITTPSTCTEPGIMTFICACGDSFTKDVGALGHNYEWSVVTDSTCFTEGLYVVGCLNCGDYYNEVMPMKDHIFDEYNFNYDATMDSDGTETSRCSRNIYCTATDTRVKPGSKLTEPPLPNWDGPEMGVVYDNGDKTYTMYVCYGPNLVSSQTTAAFNYFMIQGHGVIDDEDMGEYYEGYVRKYILVETTHGIY